MKLAAFLLLALCAVGALSSAGCSSDGYTPVCKPDLSDCLEEPKGGTYIDAPNGDAGNPD